MQAPSSRDWRSVQSWIRNKAPLVEREQEFILKKEDLVTLRTGRECAGFDGVVERMLSSTDDFLRKRLHCHIIQVGRSGQRGHSPVLIDVAAFVRHARVAREDFRQAPELLRPEACGQAGEHHNRNRDFRLADSPGRGNVRAVKCQPTRLTFRSNWNPDCIHASLRHSDVKPDQSYKAGAFRGLGSLLCGAGGFHQ